MAHWWTRALLVIAAVVAVAAAALLTRAWFDRPASGDRVFAGTFSSDDDLRVANLTIRGGHVRVGYSVEVLYLPRGADSSLECGLIDTSARLDFFRGSGTTALPGAWMRLEFEADYDLPELTLGIRCSPTAGGALAVVFRNPEVHAVPLDPS